jgi:surfeit locus 1 family protein
MAVTDARPAQAGLLRQLLWPTIFTLVAGGILVSLGIWQLHRLAWKEGLLAEIAARADAPPVAIPPETSWPHLVPIDYDYRHVTLKGRFLYDDTLRVFTPSGPQEGIGPGYLLFTPLQLASGSYVMVNRGFVPNDLAKQLAKVHGPAEATLTGLMRPPEPYSVFTPKDAPDQGEYFSRNPAILAAHLHLTHVAPFIVDVDAVPHATGWPRGGTTERDLPNNHFSYALTWFGLALGLLSVFVPFAFRKYKEAKAG